MIRRSEQPAVDRYRLVVQFMSFMLLLILVCPTTFAHPDLQLQIDELTEQLELEPDNVELLLRRGDLQRRHQNWDLAHSDFKRVREIQPDNKTVDWFDGRLEVESGRPLEGVRHLDRFLLANPGPNPGQAIALQNRAQGYLLLNQPLLAAQDLQAVISETDKPAPSLYSAAALALVAAGTEYFSNAMDIVQQGLLLFPGEIVLNRIATDLSLAESDTDTASRLLNQLPASMQTLPQWQTRFALLDCQSGEQARAERWFTKASGDSLESRNVPGLLSAEWLARLVMDPSAENCQAAALEMLNNH